MDAATGVPTVIPFGNEGFDDAAFHTGTPNTPSPRFTVPAGLAGKYLVSARVSFADGPATPSARRVDIRRNGTTVEAQAFVSTSYAGMVDVTDVVALKAGDYLEVLFYQATGGPLNITGGQLNTTFSMVRLGA